MTLALTPLAEETQNALQADSAPSAVVCAASPAAPTLVPDVCPTPAQSTTLVARTPSVKTLVRGPPAPALLATRVIPTSDVSEATVPPTRTVTRTKLAKTSDVSTHAISHAETVPTARQGTMSPSAGAPGEGQEIHSRDAGNSTGPRSVRNVASTPTVK